MTSNPTRWLPASWRRRYGALPATVGSVLANVGARVGALVALGLATIVVARTGGPTEVGIYALLRVLPGLAGVLLSCGLPAAVPYFLARPDPVGAIRGTLVVTMLLGGVVGAGCWVLGAPALQRLFFRELSLPVVAAVAAAVFTQLLVAVGKACLQGNQQLRAANVAIVAEEAAFLPVFALLLPVVSGTALLLVALVAADLVVAVGIWGTLLRRGFFAGGLRVSPRLGREIVGFGMRGQVGGLLTLVNLRLDFALLGALASPAVLGTYAIASKYAELLRLPGLAVTYVLYPRFAREGADSAASRTRKMMLPATGLGVAAAVPLAAAAALLLPALYGPEFRAAVVPSYILLLGLTGETTAGLVTAFLYGDGRPGLNSLAVGVGVALTVGLDLLLIPAHGAVGAAWASTAAYLGSTLALLLCFVLVQRTVRRPGMAGLDVLAETP